MTEEEIETEIFKPVQQKLMCLKQSSKKAAAIHKLQQFFLYEWIIFPSSYFLGNAD